MITSAINSHRGTYNQNVGYGPIIWDVQSSQELGPQRIDYNPKVSENEGRSIIIKEAELSALKKVQSKPDPFFVQQDKILTFRPPIYNDKFVLEAGYSTEKKSLPGYTIPRDTAYIGLKDSRKVMDGRPMEYSSGINNKNVNIPSTRPEVNLFGNYSNPLNGQEIPKTLRFGKIESNRNVHTDYVPRNIRSCTTIPSTSKKLVYSKVPVKTIPLDTATLRQPPNPIISKKFIENKVPIRHIPLEKMLHPRQPDIKPHFPIYHKL
jgi:hypothetical protein